MIEMRKKQKLLVIKIVEFGVYLAENKEADAKKAVCFFRQSRYLRERRRAIAWMLFIKILPGSSDCPTREPAFTVGQTAVLKVRQVTRIGAALFLGTEKGSPSSLSPGQTVQVKEGTGMSGSSLCGQKQPPVLQQ